MFYDSFCFAWSGGVLGGLNKALGSIGGVLDTLGSAWMLRQRSRVLSKRLREAFGCFWNDSEKLSGALWTPSGSSRAAFRACWVFARRLIHPCIPRDAWGAPVVRSEGLRWHTCFCHTSRRRTSSFPESCRHPKLSSRNLARP